MRGFEGIAKRFGLLVALFCLCVSCVSLQKKKTRAPSGLRSTGSGFHRAQVPSEAPLPAMPPLQQSQSQVPRVPVGSDSCPASGEGPPSWQVCYWGSCPNVNSNFSIMDLYEYSPSQVQSKSCPIAYFSAHYEPDRPDSARFRGAMSPIPGWPKEKYLLNWRHPENLKIMRERLDLAVRKGFKGVDIDNIDGPNSDAYFSWLYNEAKSRGLKVGLKNAVELLPKWGPKVDFFVSEAENTQEQDVYRAFKKPTVRMNYPGNASTRDFIFEVRTGQGGNRF